MFSPVTHIVENYPMASSFYYLTNLREPSSFSVFDIDFHLAKEISAVIGAVAGLLFSRFTRKSAVIEEKDSRNIEGLRKRAQFIDSVSVSGVWVENGHQKSPLLAGLIV